MSNVTLYLDALASFEAPATVKEVHEKAKAMFGDRVKGERASARQSLERWVTKGLVLKENGKYWAKIEAIDPVMKLTTQLKMLEAENQKLRARIAELQG
jgi:hypothetical protein